jgi:putative ABC transport system permease protein
MPAPLFRLLLRLYPRSYRRRFEAEMLETERHLTAESGPARWRAVPDLVASALAVRADLRRERRPAVSGVVMDLWFAMRSLRQVPGFTLTAVLTIALGIGAHTVVYAIVDAMLLRPLPFGDRSDRLVTLHSTHATQAPDWGNSDLSYADLLDLREQSRTLAAVEGFLERNFSVAATDDAARVPGASVTPGLFGLLGVDPLHGRMFRDDEAAEPGFEPVALISHALWQRLFGGDISIIGTPVLLNARQVTVIGVMPEGFLFPEQHQLWVPYASDRTAARANRAFIGVGLLAPDVAMGRAAADLNRVAATLATTYPDTNRGWGVHMLTLREFHVGDTRGVSSMLAAVALLLLVACANVAGLLIARGVSRERELVTRAALGAGRGRLVRLLLTEAFVIAVIGGVAGVVAAMWGLAVIVSTVSEAPAYWFVPRIDLRVVAATIVVTGVVTLLAGLAPAWRLSRVDVSAAGSSTRAAGASRGHRRFQRTLVTAQVAVSLVLLVGATLLARSAIELQRADPGFDTGSLLSGRFYIAGDAYDSPVARAEAVTRVVDAVMAIPGVTSVAATQSIPADDGAGTLMLRPTGALAGTATGADGINTMGVIAISATAGLWDTLGLSLREGRAFTQAEVLDPLTDVVHINERLATRLWPGESALDRTLQVVNARGVVTSTVRVVGVTPNLVYEEFGETTAQSQLNVYVPYGRSGSRTLAILARTSGDPAMYADTLRVAVRSVDPSFATFDVLTMADRRHVTTWGERFLAGTFSSFAVGALLLACLGTYGLVAYAAAQRRREVGVRVAIGATRADILALFVRGGVTTALAGATIGAPLALLTARGLDQAGLLFEVSPWDLWVWMPVPIVLMAAVILATLEPAVRASHVDPSEALRAQGT